MIGTNSPRAVAKFLVPDVIFGVGVLSEVGQAARRQGASHVLVVSDRGVGEAGWTGEVLGHLAEAGVSAQLWDGLTPNPKAGSGRLFGTSLSHILDAIWPRFGWRSPAP